MQEYNGILFLAVRGVAQLGAHVVWDHGAAGSIPVTSTKNKDTNIIVCVFIFDLRISSTIIVN